MYNRVMLTLLIAAGVSALGACHSAPTKVDYARPYPADAFQTSTVNIQVVRDGTEIELTNTTARSFGPCTLWINERFSKPLDGFKIGETLRFSLRDFRDQYSEPFRAGGFFATVLPDEVVKAELEIPSAEATPEATPVSPVTAAPASPAAGVEQVTAVEPRGKSRWLGLIVIGRGEEQTR